MKEKVVYPSKIAEISEELNTMDLCQVFRHIFSNNLILSYLNLFQFAY